MTSSSELPRVTVFTDGSTYPKNPGYAGWAAILKGSQWIRIVTGGQEDRSNNFAEAKAVAGALQCLRKSCRVNIFTDSMYVVHGVTRIMNKKKLLQTNADVWGELAELIGPHEINIQHVKGHANNTMNCWADEIASEAAKQKSSMDGYIPYDTSTFGEIQTNRQSRRKVLSLACAEKVQRGTVRTR